MNAQIEKIENPLLRAFAEKAQHKSTGDFGMTIYGGVDLTAYAEMIVLECCREISQDPFNAGSASLWLKKRFGVQ